MTENRCYKIAPYCHWLHTHPITTPLWEPPSFSSCFFFTAREEEPPPPRNSSESWVHSEAFRRPRTIMSGFHPKTRCDVFQPLEDLLRAREATNGLSSPQNASRGRKGVELLGGAAPWKCALQCPPPQNATAWIRALLLGPANTL